MNINKKKIAIDALNILKIKGWDKVTIKEIKKKSKIKSFDKIINSKQDILTLINQYFDFVLSLNSKILQVNPSDFNCLLKKLIAPASLGVILGNFIKSLANFNSLILAISLLINH